ncbi:MAG: phage tail protein I [Chelatococcus sp.]|nr:MAG: phage tail protein I [Chelatococcus sp.]
MTWSALLPGNAGTFEKAAVDAAEEALDIPLRQMVAPDTTLLTVLPFLAVHDGVKLWFPDWEEARKRAIVGEWAELADLIGTRQGLRRMLAYVDAQLISSVAHPRRFVAGRSAVGIQPLQFPAFAARYLIKVRLHRHIRSAIAGRFVAGKHALVRVNLEPIRRAKIAAMTAKSPATQYVATFAYRRRPTFDEMEFGMAFEAFIDRTSL